MVCMLLSCRIHIKYFNRQYKIYHMDYSLGLLLVCFVVVIVAEVMVELPQDYPLALGQSYDSPIVSEVTLNNMSEYTTYIQQEQEL